MRVEVQADRRWRGDGRRQCNERQRCRQKEGGGVTRGGHLQSMPHQLNSPPSHQCPSSLMTTSAIPSSIIAVSRRLATWTSSTSSTCKGEEVTMTATTAVQSTSNSAMPLATAIKPRQSSPPCSIDASHCMMAVAAVTLVVVEIAMGQSTMPGDEGGARNRYQGSMDDYKPALMAQ